MDLPDPCPSPVTVHRDLGPGLHHMDDVAPGLLERPIVAEFAPPVGLDELKAAAAVRVTRDDQWPRVHATRAEVHLPRHYLRDAPGVVLYLDLVHELVHVRQVLEGRTIYHRELDYVDWPTEHEAYRFTVQEARSIGCPDDWLRRYLAVPWADGAQLRRLEAAVGLTPDGPDAPTGRAPSPGERR